MSEEGVDLSAGLRDALLQLPFEAMLFGKGEGALKQYSRSRALQPSKKQGCVFLSCEGTLDVDQLQLLIQLREGFDINSTEVGVDAAWAWSANEEMAFDNETRAEWQDLGKLSQETPAIISTVNPAEVNLQAQGCHFHVLVRFSLGSFGVAFCGWPATPVGILQNHVRDLNSNIGKKLLELLCAPPAPEWGNNLEFLCRLANRRCDAIDNLIGKKETDKDDIQRVSDWIMSSIIDRIWGRAYSQRRLQTTERLKAALALAGTPAGKKHKSHHEYTAWKPVEGGQANYRDAGEGRVRVVQVVKFLTDTGLYQVHWTRHTMPEKLLDSNTLKPLADASYKSNTAGQPPVVQGQWLVFTTTNEKVKVVRCYPDGDGGVGVEIEVTRYTPAEKLMCADGAEQVTEQVTEYDLHRKPIKELLELCTKRGIDTRGMEKQELIAKLMDRGAV